MVIKKIIGKELTELFREQRFQVIAILLLVLFAIATFVSWSYYQTATKQQQVAKDAVRQHWENQGPKNPHSAAHYGMYLFKNKSALSLIDPGLDQYSGISIFVESHHRNEAQFKAAQSQSSLARFGHLSPAFILLYLMSLLIILMGFNGFTREKEGGTWRLVLSQGVKPIYLALGKWFAILIPLLLLLLPGLLITVLMLFMVEDYGSFSIWELFVLCFIYLLYYAVVINVTLLVSVWAKNSGIALIALLFVWIIWSLFIPKIVTNTIYLLHPLPSLIDFKAEIAEDKKKGLDGHNHSSQRVQELKQKTLDKYKVKDVSELPFNFKGMRFQAGEEYGKQVIDKHYQKLQQNYQNHRKIYRWTSIVSPFIAVRLLSMGITRTDFEDHCHFAEAAEQYRRMMVKMLNENLMHAGHKKEQYKADKKLWHAIPSFSYQLPSFTQTLNHYVLDMLVLAGWFIVTFLALWWKMNRSRI